MNNRKGTMRVAQVSRPGGPLELVERPIPDPGPGSVRIKVQACGVCHSDVFTKEGQWPGITFPRVPGHEVVGVIDAAGRNVPERWQPGQRVGVGWHAWHCLSCDNCRRGDFFACQTGVKVTGISFDGGYADYMVAPATALARVPAASLSRSRIRDAPWQTQPSRSHARMLTFRLLFKRKERLANYGTISAVHPIAPFSIRL